MTKFIKRVLLIGGIAFLTGAVIAAASLATGNVRHTVYWGSRGPEALDMTQNEHYVSDYELTFDSISTDLRDTRVLIQYGDGYGLDLYYYTNDYLTYQYEYQVVDGTLEFTGKSQQTQDYFGGTFLNFSYSSPKSNNLTITLPRGAELTELKLTNMDRDIDMAGIKADTLELECAYNTVSLADVQVEEAVMDLKDTHLYLTNFQTNTLVCSNSYSGITIENSTRQTMEEMTLQLKDVNLSIVNLDVGTFTVENNYASLDLNEMQVDTFVADLRDVRVMTRNMVVDSGTVTNSYESFTAEGWESNGFVFRGDNCSIEIEGFLRGATVVETTYGDVAIRSALPKDDYVMDLSTTYQSISVGNEEQEEDAYSYDNGGEHTITVNSSNTNIELEFVE